MTSEFPRRSYLAALPRVSRSWALMRAMTVSLLVAVVIFGGLTLQMALGKDPAIGPAAKVVPRAAPAVEKTPAPVEETPPPVTPAPAPVPALPAPAPAPVAPVRIPAPTPVQTSVS